MSCYRNPKKRVDKTLKSNIINTQNIIKSKFKKLYNERLKKDYNLSEKYKPITKPINELIEPQKLNSGKSSNNNKNNKNKNERFDQNDDSSDDPYDTVRSGDDNISMDSWSDSHSDNGLSDEDEFEMSGGESDATYNDAESDNDGQFVRKHYGDERDHIDDAIIEDVELDTLSQYKQDPINNKRPLEDRDTDDSDGAYSKRVSLPTPNNKLIKKKHNLEQLREIRSRIKKPAEESVQFTEISATPKRRRDDDVDVNVLKKSRISHSKQSQNKKKSAMKIARQLREIAQTIANEKKKAEDAKQIFVISDDDDSVGNAEANPIVPADISDIETDYEDDTGVAVSLANPNKFVGKRKRKNDVDKMKKKMKFLPPRHRRRILRFGHFDAHRRTPRRQSAIQATKNLRTGGSIASNFVPYKNKTDYVYFDDPNELCDRLKLLISSKSAGNTNHNSEINSIIEELYELDIIE